MSSETIPPIVQSIIDGKAVEKDEIITLRRWFYGDGIIHAEDALALFKANAVLDGRCPEFNRLFVEALTDYVVYQLMPTGRITAEKAAWLMAEMGGPDAFVETASELELLVNVMEEAHEIPNSLAAFALAQVKHAAITGEGPAARGRVHFSRTVDAADVELLGRILSHNGGAISRAEAEILFDIADACTGPANDEAWSQLFVRAIANHLLGSAAPLERAAGPAPAATAVFGPEGDWSSLVTQIDPAGASWLQSRIHRDGRVSKAERALLAFVDAPVGDTVAASAIVRMA